jgi:hypothetical protein
VVDPQDCAEFVRRELAPAGAGLVVDGGSTAQ